MNAKLPHPVQRSEREYKRTMKKKKNALAGGKALYKKRGRKWMQTLGRRSAAKRKKALKMLEASKKNKKKK